VNAEIQSRARAMKLLYARSSIVLLLAFVPGVNSRAQEKTDPSVERTAAAATEAAKPFLGEAPNLTVDIKALLSQHPLVQWRRNPKGIQFTVLRLIDHSGSRMTDNLDHGPFASENRRVRFLLVNVKKEHLDKVWWEVKSDVPARGDGHRQVNDAEKTGHNSVIWVERKSGKDKAYYLAGRWDRGVNEREFYRDNPNAAVILILE
jgi:hypothetical protein